MVMKQWIFEKAKHTDLDAIGALLEEGRAFLRAQGIDQWQSEHSPNREVAEADLQAGVGYVLRGKDGRVAAYAALIPGADPTYASIAGAWLQDGPYCTVHRQGTSAAFRGQGAAVALLQACKREAKAQGAAALRIDTHAENQIMQKVIAKGGFTYCGVITQPDGSKRNAYEQLL